MPADRHPSVTLINCFKGPAVFRVLQEWFINLFVTQILTSVRQGLIPVNTTVTTLLVLMVARVSMATN